MKIAVVGLNYSPETTGIAVYTTGLAEGMAGRGHSVRAIVGYPHYPQWKVADGYTGLTRKETVAGVPVTRLRHFVPARPALINRLIMEVSFGLHSVITRWGRPDILVFVSPALFSTGIGLLKAKLLRVPSCVWVQDIYSLGVTESGTGGGATAQAIRRVEKRILNSASSVVVIHERFKRYLVDELGVPTDRIEVVRNWSHITDTRADSREATRAGLGWAPGDVVVLHAGNMGAKQGLENVVRASRIAAARDSVVHFVLLGDGNQRETLQSMGSNTHLEYVAPLPEDQFVATLASADILLVNERAGLTEMSVPSKMTSYFTTGLPVIAATDGSSITAQEIDFSGAGIRVEADDAAGLVDAAERLGLDAERAKTFGAAGLAYAQTTLTDSSAFDRFESLLRLICRRNAGR